MISASNYNQFYKKKFINISLPDQKINNFLKLKGHKILMVGGGTGRDIYHLKKQNTIYILDNSFEASIMAQRHLINSIIQNVQSIFPFESSTFDIVVAKDILEHLDNPIATMSEIKQVLKDDGYLVLNVPNHFYLPMRLRILFGKGLLWKSIGHDHTLQYKEWNYIHKIFFSWKGFNQFINESGFYICKTFWDIGTLTHYNDLNIVKTYIKKQKSLIAGSSIYVFLIEIFNKIFPKRIRSLFGSLNPALFCASFYVWCKKSES